MSVAAVPSLARARQKPPSQPMPPAQRPFGQQQAPSDYGGDEPTNVDDGLSTHIYDPPAESDQFDDSGVPPRHSPSPSTRRRK